MLCASRLAERLGRVDHKFTQRQKKLLKTLKLPVAFPEVDRDAIIAAMAHDKKVEHGKLRFVLPTKMGHVELVGDIDEVDVRAALDE
jgi:3-dehydroquinate synthase